MKPYVLQYYPQYLAKMKSWVDGILGINLSKADNTRLLVTKKINGLDNNLTPPAVGYLEAPEICHVQSYDLVVPVKPKAQVTRKWKTKTKTIKPRETNQSEKVVKASATRLNNRNHSKKYSKRLSGFDLKRPPSLPKIVKIPPAWLKWIGVI
jgi:hypothetical protein